MHPHYIRTWARPSGMASVRTSVWDGQQRTLGGYSSSQWQHGKSLWGDQAEGEVWKSCYPGSEQGQIGRGVSGFYSIFGNSWKSSMSFEQLYILKRISFALPWVQGQVTQPSLHTSCLGSGKPPASPARGTVVWTQEGFLMLPTVVDGVGAFLIHKHMRFALELSLMLTFHSPFIL